jgi:hypothetical protein
VDANFKWPLSLSLALGPTQPPIRWVRVALSLGGKAAEADFSPPSSTEIKNAWSYTSTSQYVFMAWCLVKHRGNSSLPYGGWEYFVFMTIILTSVLSTYPSVYHRITNVTT